MRDDATTRRRGRLAWCCSLRAPPSNLGMALGPDARGLWECCSWWRAKTEQSGISAVAVRKGRVEYQVHVMLQWAVCGLERGRLLLAMVDRRCSILVSCKRVVARQPPRRRLWIWALDGLHNTHDAAQHTRTPRPGSSAGKRGRRSSVVPSWGEQERSARRWRPTMMRRRRGAQCLLSLSLSRGRTREMQTPYVWLKTAQHKTER